MEENDRGEWGWKVRKEGDLQPHYGTNISYGLIHLGCDKDVLQMVHKLPKDKIIKLYTKKDFEEEINGSEEVRDNNDDFGDGTDNDDDYYPETDSDDSVIFEDDQFDPFDDEDIQDKLYKSMPS
ncbi:hypothetical protein LINGRAHAP2_LOCUS20346 [Linum grandiflorum]